MLPLKDNIPSDHFPVITVILIVINLLVFGWQLSKPDDEQKVQSLAQVGISERFEASLDYGAIPARITNPGADCGVTIETKGNGRPSTAVVCGSQEELADAAGGGPLVPLDGGFWALTLLTSMFMHGGLLHIGGNMLFLWVFGNNVEDSMGKGRFLVFYLLAGLVAVYSQAVIDPDSTIPTIGASGAVAGILGAYAVLHPKARVLSLVFIIFFVTFIQVPALLLLSIWFLLQFLPAAGQLADQAGGGGVAYLAHVGGFIFGLLAIKLFAHRKSGDPISGGADSGQPAY